MKKASFSHVFSICIILLLILHLPFRNFGQTNSKNTFNAGEYREMLGLFQAFIDSIPAGGMIPQPTGYKRVYSSPVVGLLNRWDLWVNDKTAAIIIRGTTIEATSWLENFYAAMVPATGNLQLNDSTGFSYKLAERSDAMVHVGWLTGLAHLSPSMIGEIKNWYAKGVKDFIIMGHSQGGALAFLTRSYLFYLSESGELPKDISFRTYCSAAPKPGNLYYAYDFDFITRNETAFRIVNTSDWVPETPFSIQTLTDFNTVNPFVNVKGVLKKQSLLVRLYLNKKYNRMDRLSRKAQREFTSTLGNMMYKQVKKTLPEFKQPTYTASSNYMTAGVPVILMPDDAYKEKYPDNPDNVFRHHLLEPYYMLSARYLK